MNNPATVVHDAMNEEIQRAMNEPFPTQEEADANVPAAQASASFAEFVARNAAREKLEELLDRIGRSTATDWEAEHWDDDLHIAILDFQSARIAVKVARLESEGE